MFDEQAVTTHCEPYFRRTAALAGSAREEHTRNVAAAASEAAERDMAMARAMNPPRVRIEPPRVRAPVVADDFLEQISALDARIYNRGVALKRDRLLSLGKERFAELLALDRTARI